MKRIVELKHVAPKAHVRALLDKLIDRLEERLGHFSQDALSIHVLFEENGAHTLYRTSLSCHVPGHMVAAHEEGREAGMTIRKAFAELERQLEKQKACLRREHLRKRVRRQPKGTVAWLIVGAVWGQAMVHAQDVPLGSPTPRAVEAMQLLESNDPYLQQLGFLRLEALREPATVPTISSYLKHRNPDLRTYSLRALAAIQGVETIPLLLDTLGAEKQPRVRRAALLGLEPLHRASPEILPAFIKALRDRSTEVRMTAVDIVSRIDDPRAREAILTRYQRERRRDVRRVLELALKRLRS